MSAETPLTAAEQEDLQALAGYMRGHGLLLATAESCTAGMIASFLADIPGAGELLDCAFATYSVQAKQRCLGVDPELLRRHNLTSEPVARAMAEGAARLTPANVIVANTGVADGGGAGVPAGTQCYAWLYKRDGAPPAIYTETRRFPGDRSAVRRASALYALSRVAHYHAAPAGGPQGSLPPTLE
ncbi:CinA family protein [Burkholderia multivorans]|uniref:CinA family protein n=1 Tax=Burkholderia multivorans TaxID=87883 RepID=UPI001C20FBA2|nr:nicotinamide-nucleotide amidohydrolase family protein [Burkholderia multivorans]MBU9365993.1 nicotinamide-nucleotide amidohydrolase family protein [Burkholderia multivorans]